MDLYSYPLPKDRIAKKPASPRDHSKLLIYNTQTDQVQFDRFINLHKYLPTDSFLVMNESKVLPARVLAKRENGEEVELMILPSEVDHAAGTVKATANKRLRLGQRIVLKPEALLEVTEDTEKAFTFRALFDLHQLPKLLLEIGHTPVPHYIGTSELSEAELRKKYQSIFAKNPGSVAAPTASLHFTPRVFKKLAAAGIPSCFVTLHIGLGTFAPVLPEHFETGTLYQEHTTISPQAAKEIRALKAAGRRCTAVGTTAVRTLESFALGHKETTNLFIFPPFEFALVDQLLTNFHLPNSSLMMLVEAFLQHKKAKRHLKDLYALAIQNDFRFYSFGDSMLIL
ncbi:MAG: tRNA preQ1(34) S-adenosylmethionine ribosyltransferase-isomerase QueA [Candidatus Gracilibacteria bacterium]|jgi:S-adenosylmethionine:tRNA ribosyltransferase-isomerase